MADCRIVEDGLTDPRVLALVEHHGETAHAATTGGPGHSFSAERLRSPDIRFFSAWLGNGLAGIGAFKVLSSDHGEIKSMHTVTEARGKGVGGALLSRIEEAARGMALKRLSLETHPGDHFAAAIALYRRHGFTECPPFGEYEDTPASIFMTKELN